MFTLLVFFPHLSFSEKQEIKPVTHEESSTETLCLQINVSLGLEGIQGAIDFTGDNLGSKQDRNPLFCPLQIHEAKHKL